MKIGIATFFDNYSNEGQLVQAFCMCEIVKSKGHKVELINYQDPIRQKTLKNLGSRHGNRAFADTLPIGEKFQSWKCLNKYDLILIGSDEVLKTNKLSLAPIGSGWPNIFYPTTDVPYVYFAASCGGACEVDQEMIDIVGKAKFRGFRDSETGSMFNLDYDLVPDPTFMVDIGNYVDINVPFEKISLHDGRHPHQNNFNPLEWFHSFSMFSYVETDRMHPTVACLKYGTDCHTTDTRFKTKELLNIYDAKKFRELYTNFINKIGL